MWRRALHPPERHKDSCLDAHGNRWSGGKWTFARRKTCSAAGCGRAVSERTSGGSRVRASGREGRALEAAAGSLGGRGRRRSPERSAGAAKPRALRPDDVGGGGRTLRSGMTRPRLRHEAGRAGATRRAVGRHKGTGLEARRTRRLERLTRREPPTHPQRLGDWKRPFVLGCRADALLSGWRRSTASIEPAHDVLTNRKRPGDHGGRWHVHTHGA